MRLRLAPLGGMLMLLVALAAPRASLAHPLGNFTVNHYSRLEPAGDGVRITYVLDMAEIPTFQEQSRIDTDGNGRMEAHELEAYATARAEDLGRGLRLDLDGVPTALRVVSRALSFPPGQGGLPTLRLEAEFRADLPAGATDPIALRFRDENAAGRIGWREIVARPAGSGTQIDQASVPTSDRTNELRSYPDDLLDSPLDVREARLTFVPGGARPSAGLLGPLSGALEQPKDTYAELVAADELTPSAIFFSLFAALTLGALHALSPGHGKTVVAAYLVGARGTARHAVFLGATVTATHTIGVYTLGLVTLYLSQYILPERLYPILQVTSGLLVIGIGAWLFSTRLRGALAARRVAQLAQAHDHSDSRDHTHSHGHGHPHAGTEAPSRHSDHVHDQHAQAHHAHDERGHRAHELGHAHDEHARAQLTGELVHSHGGRAHSHLPPGADGQSVTWRSLLALGVSGGLVPCPSALVVLLSAIALHRVAFGLVLIVAFSLGLAAVLVGIGLLLVYARHLFQRVSIGGQLAPRLVPVASALLIVATGVALVIQALPIS